MAKLLCIFLLVIATSCLGQNIITVAGNGNPTYLGDGGQATDASLGGIGMIKFDRNGNLYISELNHTVRKISPTGIISTVAGNGTTGYSGDGLQATQSQLHTYGAGIAIDNSDNLYIADFGNNRIRKVDISSGIITTFAGTGVTGFSGDGSAATSAHFNAPTYICFNPIGELFVADIYNYRIRKIRIDGVVTTVCGNGNNNSSGDGGSASTAEISNVIGMCTDAAGNLFFVENNRVRKIDITGNINTVAGTGITGFSGDGSVATAATLSAPYDVIVDKQGIIYISDRVNNRIRKINISNTINTIAGNGSSSFSGDGGLAIDAGLYNPKGLALDTCGNLYLADNGNMRIRKISFNPDCLPISVKEVHGNEATTITLHPNPATETLTITAGVEIETTEIVNAVGQTVKTADGRSRRQIPVDVSELPPGVYMVRVNEVWVGKFVKE